MAKQLTYIHFQSLPVKVRKFIVAHILVNQEGYTISNEKKEKSINKAIVSFQKSIGLAGNGIICEKTFNALGYIDDSIVLHMR